MSLFGPILGGIGIPLAALVILSTKLPPSPFDNKQVSLYNCIHAYESSWFRYETQPENGDIEP